MHKTESLLDAKDKLLTVTSRPEIVMHAGEGAYLTDTEGRKYLDFIAGWAVNSLGHSPQVISEILSKQAKQLVNSSPSFYNTPMLEYADRLTDSAQLDRVFFTSTGAEANESAIKLARKYGSLRKSGAYEIITTHHSFHGRTLTTMAATGKTHWEDLFEPKSKGFLKANYNDLNSIKSLMNDKTCAVMLEPIQGEGGVNVPSLDFMQGLRELCTQTNTLLIFDEVQTGMGRTGEMFCFEHFGIKPDILTLGKGIGGGFPLSAMLCTEALNIFEPGDQGGTYTGQPLAMAVGLAVLNELQNNDVLENCRQQSHYLFERLTTLSEKYAISNIRGMGLLIAFDCDQQDANQLSRECLNNGLLINAPKANSIRLMPPLTIKKEEIDSMLDMLSRSIEKLNQTTRDNTK